MPIAIRTAQTTWEGPLASGAGAVRMGSGAMSEMPVTWASRTERADWEGQPGGTGGRGALRLLRDSAIFVVATVARATLGTADRVAFFRGLGRAYGLVGGAALTVALACGAVLAAAHRWDGQLTASTMVAAALVAVTVAGMVQGRQDCGVLADTAETQEPGGFDRVGTLEAALRGRLGLPPVS
jgi:hypothetical protein